MNWEAISGTVALAGLVLAVAGFGAPTLIFFGKVLEKLDNMNRGMSNFQINLDKHMDHEERMHKAIWEKSDAHSLKIENHAVRIDSLEKNA